MRFAVAKQEGLSEDRVEAITDDYRGSHLPIRQQLAVAFADQFLSADGVPQPALQSELLDEFTPDQLAELATGMALFHGFSKLIVALGCEPEQMDLTELPTPIARS